jgi:hypothetical protein
VTIAPAFIAAAGAPNQTLAIVLLVGLAALTISLGVLMWTRWGQAQPLGKCVALSVFAHLLLLVYAYATQVFFETPGKPDSDVFEVRLVHTGDDEDTSPWVDPDAEVVPPTDLTDLLAGPVADEDSNSIASPEQPAATSEDVANAEKANLAPSLLTPPPTKTVANDAGTAESSNAVPLPSTVEELANAMTDLASVERSPPSSSVDDRIPELVADAGTNTPATAAPEPPSIDRRDVLNQEPSTEHPTPFAAPPDGDTSPRSVATGRPPMLPRRSGDGQSMPQLFIARVASDRITVAEQHGGDVSTEAAVNGALQWLAAHQSADGRWDADAHGAGREISLLGHNRGGAGAKADTGITGLALLAMLGAGNTHLDGKYREQVQHGLEFILSSQAASGSLQGDAELFASMYCHGIATLALSEAYAMTGDSRLKPGLQRAIHYTLESQHAAGGWRYQPGDAGDMSQFGWQVMALKSAEIGGLPIPDETRVRMTSFLRTVTSGRQRGLVSYRPGERPSRTMTAEALVCRSLAGIENSIGVMDEGSRFILEELPGSSPKNFYYYYYATLAIYQRQGADWDRWNKALQHELLRDQRSDGDAAGSWDPDTNWGSYGGRVYSTALGALCLEVYYRYLPLYENDFPVEPRWTERPGGQLPR